MANTDAKFGARPISTASGHTTGALSRYSVSVADALYVGDIVSLAGSADADGVPTAIACTPCLIPVGIIVSFEDKDGVPDSQLYKKSGDSLYALVADDPSLRFEIQTDAAIAATDFGLNADLVFAEGSTITGRSGMELDVGTKGTSAALHMHLERLVQSPDNEVGDAAVVECTWSQHAKGAQVGT